MDIYEEKQIQELPLGIPLFKKKVEDFLRANGLRLEKVDLYMAIQDADEHILAGGGIARDTIKCIAVSEEARSEGLAVPLISRLIAVGAERGYTNIKVFTKPENRAVFESLGFRTLAQAPKAIFMENGSGLRDYLRCLDFARHGSNCHFDRSGEISSGVALMNANPFTIGHKYLIEKALEQVERLFVIVVKEDVSRFPYAERLATVKAACSGLDRVTVCEGSDYQISAATFPTYFLKELSDASETQMRLDLDLFCRHIAPALGATVRFVGTEPTDALTARYNALMKEVLPSLGIQVVEIPRHARPSFVCHARPDRASDPVTATAVRVALDAGRFALAASMVPSATIPALLADRAEWALRQELSLPGKPGLVGPDGPGAHKDMDYNTMLKGIAALRPYFYQLGCLGFARHDNGCFARHDSNCHFDSTDVCHFDRSGEISSIGKAAEQAMLAATGGINTHQGAIFSIGLMIASVEISPLASLGRNDKNTSVLPDLIGHLASLMPDTPRTKEWAAMGVKGPLALAREGYKDLFSDWLPYYRFVKGQPDGMHKTLLRIMSSLDDTCIIRRAGLERAREVKREAGEILRLATLAQNDNRTLAQNDVFKERLRALNAEFCREGISPGGAADMLALTIFADSIELK